MGDGLWHCYTNIIIHPIYIAYCEVKWKMKWHDIRWCNKIRTRRYNITRYDMYDMCCIILMIWYDILWYDMILGWYYMIWRIVIMIIITTMIVIWFWYDDEYDYDMTMNMIMIWYWSWTWYDCDNEYDVIMLMNMIWYWLCCVVVFHNIMYMMYNTCYMI